MDTALSLRSTRIAIARAWLFGIDVDRRKAIDDTIDYFGSSESVTLSSALADAEEVL